MSRRSSNFLVQGSILAAASILVRLIGMLYRVPLTGLIGTKGNAYYTSAFSIYTLMLILSSFSMPVAISRIVSENIVRHQYKNTARVLRVAFVYASLMGGLMFCILWFGSGAIAELLQKPYSRFALQALAPTVWIMAYLGILRGYFQGLGTMVPTAISQLFEQIVNAVISLLAAWLLLGRGELANQVYHSDQYGYAFGAAGGAIGTGAGALTALLFFAALYWLNRRERRRMQLRDRAGRQQSYSEIAWVLGATMIPILISSTVYNISAVLDDYIFSNMMERLGHAEALIVQWGVFGEYHILFNIPVALANALSSSLIPSLTRAVTEGSRTQTALRIRYAIRFTLLIALPSAFGMAALAEPICRLLFPGAELALLVRLTRVGAAAVVFFSLSTISNGILQGMGKMKLPLKNAVISLFIHLAALMALLFAGTQIYGVVLANIVFAAAMCVLNQWSIQRHFPYRQGIQKTYVLPTLAAAVMAGAVWLCSRLLSELLPQLADGGRVGALLLLLPSMAVALLVYFGMLLFLKAFDRRDLEHMPFGRKLMRFV